MDCYDFQITNFVFLKDDNRKELYEITALSRQWASIYRDRTGTSEVAFDKLEGVKLELRHLLTHGFTLHPNHKPDQLPFRDYLKNNVVVRYNVSQNFFEIYQGFTYPKSLNYFHELQNFYHFITDKLLTQSSLYLEGE